MPVRLPEHAFRVDNSPSRVQDTERNQKTQLVKNTCPGHEYRSRTKRMGQVAKYCALCMDQQEMAARWKNIRRALATIRRFTRKSSAASEPASVSPARAQLEVSIEVRVDLPLVDISGHGNVDMYRSIQNEIKLCLYSPWLRGCACSRPGAVSSRGVGNHATVMTDGFEDSGKVTL